MAGRPEVSHDCARDGEPRLAGLLWKWIGYHVRGLRHAKRTAIASGTARLAGHGFHGSWMELQTSAPAHCEQRYLSAILEGDTGSIRERSFQSLARARAAFSCGR